MTGTQALTLYFVAIGVTFIGVTLNEMVRRRKEARRRAVRARYRVRL